ncbi:MAG: hypothetical protein LC799_23095, partial [Actinobacteria bacterium]|nr:hypothetical protein [Actinomycetota bacterium]
RVVRGARFMIFTVVFPVVLYLIDANLFAADSATYQDGMVVFRGDVSRAVHRGPGSAGSRRRACGWESSRSC